MDKLKVYLWIVILLFITACGSENKATIITGEHFSFDPESTSVIKEGSIGRLIINNELENAFTINAVQKSGVLTFIKEAKANRIEFVAPNVTTDQTIEVEVVITTEDNEQAKLSWSVLVENRLIKSLELEPKANVFSSSNIAKHDARTFDSVGVPTYQKDGEQYYYPVDVAQYAYDFYNYYLKVRTNEARDKFLTAATWLRDNCEYTDYGFCSYRAYFEISAYKLTTDWTTAMAQGQAISSLIAAHYLTGDESYGQVAYDAVSAFNYPIIEKGLTSDLEGSVWYEEYGSEEMPAHVLNGFLFSLSGVNDFYQNYQEGYAKVIFDVGVKSLEDKIYLFNFDFTSRYDYSPLKQLASTKGGPDGYHEIHIFQLAWIVSVTDSTIIRDAAQTFLMQDMGGIKSISNYRDSKEIINITASHSIDSVNYGVDKLTDANWTWDKYWSSHRFGTSLTLELNEDVLEAGKLNKLVLTSEIRSDFPKEFDIFEIDEYGQTTLLKAAITVIDNAEVEYEHETGGYLSYTVVFNLNLALNTNKIMLKFYGADGGVVKLRELDVHYNRTALLEKIINAYRTKQ